METLPAFLKQRGERHFRYLLKQIEGLTPEAALRDRRPDWPGQPWGIGQDGSIAGIVYHLAAWKQMTLPLLQPGGQAGAMETFDRAAAPAPEDWNGIVAWLRRVGTEWNEAVARLPESAFDEMREWEGMTLPLGHIIMHIVEHDIMHTAQIEYLLQRQHLSNITVSDLPL